MSRQNRKAATGGKKKIKPISFGEDDEDEVETLMMADVPIVTASIISSDPMSKKKASYMNNSQHDDMGHPEDEDDDDNGSVSKFLNKSLSKTKSKNQVASNSSANLLSGAPPMSPSREPSLVSSNFQPVKPWPSSLRNKIAQSLKAKQNEAGAREFLSRHLWPSGLRDALIKSCKKLPLRFFIVDDSGSMI